MRPRSYLIGALLFALVLAVLTEKAHAMPAFARKYRTSCATCHEAYPRLNGVGEAFRLNGYKFADDELYIKDEPVELGDEAYKRLWPSSIWPNDMPGMPPISMTLDNQATYDIGGTEVARSEFKFPQEAKILGAGAMGENISAFLELGFERHGAGAADAHGGAVSEEGTETEIEGWIQFEDLFGTPNTYNLRVGTIGMQELGLFTARDHNRFTISNYLYSAWAMPTPTAHNIDDVIAAITDHDDVDFDGNPFTSHAQPGVELNGFGRSWRYALGIVNGNGHEFNDNNTEKDAYLQLAYKIGGLGFDGSGMEEQDGLGGGSDPWRDDSVTVSLFGYWGTSPIDIERAADDFESRESDRYWRAGPGLLWRTGDLQLGGGYIWGKNDNPFGALSNGPVDSKSWFAEVNYFAKPWLIPYTRYETLELVLPSEVTKTDEASWVKGADRARFIVGTKMLLRANVTLGLEGALYVNDERETTDDDNSVFAASLNVAF